MKKILDPTHFLSPDVVSHARNLLGKKLVTVFDGQYCAGIITETEAYRAPDDKACHAYQNKRTARTEIMFGDPGYAYVYLCYGIHMLLNVVTGPKESAHAVLIRSIEPTEGIDIMLQRRGLSNPKNLTNGPGKLTKALGIEMSSNGINLHTSQHLWIEETDFKPKAHEILASKRIGVDYAEECAEWEWRFVVGV